MPVSRPSRRGGEHAMPRNPTPHRPVAAPAVPLESLERRLMFCDLEALTPGAASQSLTVLADSPVARVAADFNTGSGLPTPPPLAWTTGLKRILYLRVTFADQPDSSPQTLGSA